jgi:hypothetical protein
MAPAANEPHTNVTLSLSKGPRAKRKRAGNHRSLAGLNAVG